tara:strand:- start:112 stop:900 length:789 start_codon:yes stop_codon:yes gene_type:complete
MEIEWLNDLKFYLALGDSGIIGNYYFHIYDYEESIFLIHFLKDKDLVIDVGANHGHYALISSGICGTKSILIEPVKTTYDRLLMNIEINMLNNVRIENIGLSDDEGSLYFTNNLGSMNRVVETKNLNFSDEVKVSTLDKILSPKEEPKVIKIDVEGYEKKVLLGSSKTLKNHNLNVIIIELNNSNSDYGYHENDIISFLSQNGFKPYKYIYPGNILIPIEKKNFNSFNTIFIRDINYVEKRIKQKSISIHRNNIKVDKFNNT